MGPSPLPPESALWLEFPSPRGFLYIVPWERLLEPLPGRSMFRLPNHLIRPEAPRRTFEVAIRASAPLAKAPFEHSRDRGRRVVGQYLSMTGRDVSVHIFTDDEWFSSVQGMFAGAGAGHRPRPRAAAADYAAPGRTSQVGTSIHCPVPGCCGCATRSASTPLDFVHFVAHGYLPGDQGAIALAASPIVNTDREWSRFIGSVQLDTFLSQVGAWGLALPGRRRTSRRRVAGTCRRHRPDPARGRDDPRFARDSDAGQLGMVLQTILRPARRSSPVPAVTCWVHPEFVEIPDTYLEELNLNVDGGSVFVTDATKAALAESNTASWVASASRVLETQQMRWLPDSADVAPDPAAVTALLNVADLVERHVNTAYPQQQGGGDS